MKTFLLILLLLITIIVQENIMPLVSLWGIELRLTTLALIYIAAKLEIIPLILIAALAGLIRDSYEPTLLGASVAAFTSVSFLLGNIIKSVDFSRKLTYLFLPFLAVVVQQSIYLIFTPQRATILSLLFKSIIPEALLSAGVCFIVILVWEGKNALSC